MRKIISILGAIIIVLLIAQCAPYARAEVASASTGAEKQVLTLYGSTSYELTQGYLAAHPGVSIEYLSNMDAHQLLDRAVAHDEEPDIYCLSSVDAPFYPSMRDRGFLAEIPGETAKQFVASVYAGIQEECYDANHALRAIPVSAVIGNRLAVNSPLWESLNLGEIPQTWAQMFDFLEKWCQDSEMNARCALLPYTSANETRNMIGYILRADYDTYRKSFEDPPRYSTEVYQNLLHRLQDLPLDKLRYDVEYEDTLLTDMFLPSPANDAFSEASMTCLQLSIDGSVPVRPLANVNYLCVNPSSGNMELALDFVNYFVENLPQNMEATLCPDFDAPVASDALEQREAEYNEQMESLAARYEATDDSAEQTALQLEMEQLSREFQYYLQDSAYLIDEDSLARYHRDIQNGVVVNYGEGVLDADELSNLSDKHEMFIAGMLTVEQYTEVLDQIVYMQEQEWK